MKFINLLSPQKLVALFIGLLFVLNIQAQRRKTVPTHVGAKFGT